MATGRPTTYNEKIADEICDLMAVGNTVIDICRREGFPPQGTLYRWLEKQPTFREKYARAREKQADFFAEQIVDIADTSTDWQKARLQLDARKWFASKVAPKKYGEKVEQTIQGSDGGPVRIERVIVDPTASD